MIDTLATAHAVDRNVRQKTTPIPSSSQLDTLPKDTLYVLVSRLSASELGCLMLYNRGLRNGLRGAVPEAPYEVVMHGTEVLCSILQLDTPLPPSRAILSAPPRTELGRRCRNIMESGVAGRLRRLRVFLWNGLCTEVPEVDVLVRACGALEMLELCMPPFTHRNDRFIRCAFILTQRIFEAAPPGLTKLQVPIVPGMLIGSGFMRFANLEHLTIATYGAGQDMDERLEGSAGWREPCQGLIESILLQLPRLRSLVVRSGFQGLMPDIKLVSESLESFVIKGGKEDCVGFYRCPRLRTLQLNCTWPPEGAWIALETGTHALDLTTVPEDCTDEWCRHGFANGVFTKCSRIQCPYMDTGFYELQQDC